MTQDVVDADELMRLAAMNPVRAHEEARHRVASDPRSELAALQLRAVIRDHPAPVHPSEVNPPHRVPTPVREARDLIERGADEDAELLLRRHLARTPHDPDAMQLMAEVAGRCGFPEDAVKILRRASEQHPSRAEIWRLLGTFLVDLAAVKDRPSLAMEALRALDQAITVEPANLAALSYKAALLIRMHRLSDAEATIRILLAYYPDAVLTWVNLGHVLKTVGRLGEAIAAYRTAVATNYRVGQAWWQLANVKNVHFFKFDVEDMQAALGEQSDTASEVDLQFGLAHAFEQFGDFAQAWSHLKSGNAAHRRRHPYDVDEVERKVVRSVEIFTRDFFATRRGYGEPSEAPIFIVGMPRAGSTLIEQILATHPEIEGAGELLAMPQVERQIAALAENSDSATAASMLSSDELCRFGTRYLELAGIHRRTQRPRFTDKNPRNWLNVGLICAILPNAKIIDARRSPMDCCFANFAQKYDWGAEFSYSQVGVAEEYVRYLRLMRHFDVALPGRIHRVIHEDLVDDLEREVRDMVKFLGLPFDAACLRFHETEREIFTPSSEQVRRPINREGIGKWRRYEPWLDELQTALGDTLDHWRD